MNKTIWEGTSSVRRFFLLYTGMYFIAKTKVDYFVIDPGKTKEKISIDIIRLTQKISDPTYYIRKLPSVNYIT